MSATLSRKSSWLSRASLTSTHFRLASSRRRRSRVCCSDSSTPVTFVRIYWDMDNIKPPANSKAGTKIVQALKDAMAAAASEGFGRQIAPRSVELHAHYNEHTSQELSKELAQALLTHGRVCVSAALPVRAEAVDQSIIASMLRFAGEHRSSACVGIISEDQGFAAPLRYCRSLGCHTVAVCKKRPYSGKGRSTRWARQPLQAAAHVALSWDAVLDAVTARKSLAAALAQEESLKYHPRAD